MANRPWQQLPCLRLNPAGSVVVEFRAPQPSEEVKYWMEYNRRYRPDCALFVSDKLVDRGTYYTTAEAAVKALGDRRAKALLP